MGQPRNRITLATILLSLASASGQFLANSYTCQNCPPGLLIASHDDSFGDPDAIGIYQDIRVAQMVSDRGLFDFFPIVGCHFANTPLPDSRSGVCYGYGKVPLEMVARLKKLGIIVVSHSFSHVSHPNMTPDAIVSEMRLMQDLLSPFENDLGIYAYRCPGLNCGAREASLVNAAPDLSTVLKGPIGADVGGWFLLPDGTPVGATGGSTQTIEPRTRRAPITRRRSVSGFVRMD